MAGNIFWKERASYTLNNRSGGTLATVTAVAASSNLDCRASGNGADDFVIQFELLCQWATITSIVANTLIADLYLVPALDGTNFPDVDTTGGSSNISPQHWVASFTAAKAPTANVDMRFTSAPVLVLPLLYKPYLLNRSGQTMSGTAVGPQIIAVSAQEQYS